MIEALRDPLWQFVGAVLALLALPTAIWIYLLQRPRKEIAYGVLSSRKILSVDSAIRSRVLVTVDGKPVEVLHLALLGVKNSGNVPIVESDFSYVPSIKALDMTEVISATVGSFTPVNLQVSLSLQQGEIIFHTPLLNPGDYFIVQALASGETPRFASDFRLVGTSKTELLRRSRPFSSTSDKVALGFWFAWLAFMIALSTLMDTVIKKAVFIGIPSTVMFIVFLVWARSRFGTQASRYVDRG